MFTRLRLLTLLVFCVIATSNFIGRATPLKVTSKERMEYQNQIKHFLQETYYATLGLAITEEDIHREVAEDLMTYLHDFSTLSTETIVRSVIHQPLAPLAFTAFGFLTRPLFHRLSTILWISL